MPSTFRGAVMGPPFATVISAAADPILLLSAPATTDQTCSTDLSYTKKKTKAASSPVVLVDSLTYSEQDDDDDNRRPDNDADEMMTLDTSSLSYDLFSYATTTDDHDDEYDDDDDDDGNDDDEKPLAGEAMDDPDDDVADDDDDDVAADDENISGSSPSASSSSSLISSFYHSQSTPAEKDETIGPTVVQLRFPKIDKNGHVAPFEEFTFHAERLWSTIAPQLEAGKAPTDIWVDLDLPLAATTIAGAAAPGLLASRRLSAQVWMGSLLPLSTYLFEVFFAKNRDHAAAVRAHQVQLLRELDHQHLYQKVQYWIADIVELESVPGSDIGLGAAAYLADAMHSYYFTDAETEFLDNFWLIDNNDDNSNSEDGIVITMSDLFHTELQVLDVLVGQNGRRTLSQLLIRLFDLPFDYFRCPLFQQQRVAWITADQIDSGKDPCCCRLLPSSQRYSKSKCPGVQ